MDRSRRTRVRVGIRLTYAHTSGGLVSGSDTRAEGCGGNRGLRPGDRLYLSGKRRHLAGGGGRSRGSPAPTRRNARPASPTPSSSASASSPSDNTVLTIERARWEGDKVVAEGAWHGDLSSVHCDLLEGSRSGQAIDWWDRSVAAETSFSGRTFSQEFVRARGDVENHIDPKSKYWATCWGQFSDGLATGADTPVKGTPPAG